MGLVDIPHAQLARRMLGPHVLVRTGSWTAAAVLIRVLQPDLLATATTLFGYLQSMLGFWLSQEDR